MFYYITMHGPPSVAASLSRGVPIQGGLCPGGKERAVHILLECTLVSLAI